MTVWLFNNLQLGPAVAAAVALLLFSGCSIKRLAVNKLGDALAAGGTSFASDEDPDLIRDAAPFSLKTMEALLAESPRHVELRRAAAAGFTQYAYAFVQMEADHLEQTDFAASERLRERCRRLYLRARSHGLRGLEVLYPGFEAQLRAHPDAAVKRLKRSDLALVFWTGASWAAAISQSKDRPELVGELPLVARIMDRAFELDADWNHGALHSFLIPFEMTRPGHPADASARSQAHFDKAVALSKGSLASAFVSFAESVALPKNDRSRFEALLEQALKIDLDQYPESRLENTVMQGRARWLLSRMDELFVVPAKK